MAATAPAHRAKVPLSGQPGRVSQLRAPAGSRRNTTSRAWPGTCTTQCTTCTTPSWNVSPGNSPAVTVPGSGPTLMFFPLISWLSTFQPGAPSAASFSSRPPTVSTCSPRARTISGTASRA
ncbi:MAG: hypothetical protein IPH09_14215 [bacterium]|nr:hypothetical protein [bacterium]